MANQHAAFFQDVTVRVCSSLNVETAMQRAFACLEDRLPLDELHLDVLDPELGAVRRVAQVSRMGAEPAVDIFPLTADLWAWTQTLLDPLLVSPDPSRYPHALWSLMKVKGHSEILTPLRADGRTLGVLVLRAHGEGRYTEEHARLLGAVADPFSIALGNALAHEELLRHREELLDDRHFFNRESTAIRLRDIVGSQGGLRQVMEMVFQVAPLHNTILITGETGVGKEVIASAIHHLSSRREAPFLKVNCGAIPENLIDSELFGYEKGAFTGAVGSRRGRFERAQGGTLFLDEIGELSPQAQVRLLRVLQSREIERVGGSRTLQVDVRVIAATHRNLAQMVEEGRFREDLWFRLNIFPIDVPPLRERREDIPALVRRFMAVKCQELGIKDPPALTPGALVRLGEYAWPGNVRELENLVERELIRHPRGPLFTEMPHAAPHAGPRGSLDPRALRLDEAMARHIRLVLDHTRKVEGTGGAAEVLGLHPSTLRNRMRKLGVH